MVGRISVELTNRCSKACWFCYSGSSAAGETAWTVEELVAFVTDCADHGVQAVSFGGGEPLEYDGIYEVLRSLRSRLFRSLTSNGRALRDPAVVDALVDAAPDKVHLSVHFPADVEPVIEGVRRLRDRGIRAGVNLLVARSAVASAARSAHRLRRAGITNDSIVYLPMRGTDTPAPREVAEVAGDTPFQSTTCLGACAASPRFCSISWDRKVGWCSYTAARHPLETYDHAGLVRALTGLGLTFCGGTDGAD